MSALHDAAFLCARPTGYVAEGTEVFTRFETRGFYRWIRSHVFLSADAASKAASRLTDSVFLRIDNYPIGSATQIMWVNFAE